MPTKEGSTSQATSAPKTWPFALYCIVIIAMAGTAMFFRPDQASNVATIGGMVLTSLMAIRAEQKALRHTVNSQLDAYKKLIWEAATAREKERQRTDGFE